MNPIKEKFYLAVDTADLNQAKSWVSQLKNHIGGAKLGMEFMANFGFAGVEAIQALGLPIFLDTKFHDIPNTVAGALSGWLRFKPSIINIHAQGGREMIARAADTVHTQSPTTKLLAVTILTSLDDKDLKDIGVKDSVTDQVRRLAELTHQAGADGVVCSPHEIEILRQDRGPDFQLLVPGIRPGFAQVNDQKRVMTPTEALAKGADYLVIGRAVTAAADPVEAMGKIYGEL